MGAQKGAVAARLVRTAAEERHAPAARRRADAFDRRLRLRAREAREVAPPVLRPPERAGAEGPQQRDDRPQLLFPEVDAILANAPRPEPHDEHAGAVAGARRIVDAPGDDHDFFSRSSDFLNFSHGSTSSMRGVNQT